MWRRPAAASTGSKENRAFSLPNTRTPFPPLKAQHRQGQDRSRGCVLTWDLGRALSLGFVHGVTGIPAWLSHGRGRDLTLLGSNLLHGQCLIDPVIGGLQVFLSGDGIVALEVCFFAVHQVEVGHGVVVVRA